MHRTGIATLPLHYGSAPRWLFNRMVKLAEGIAGVIVYEYSSDELLRRLSDPFWFQALSCVLGFDWHSSGTTTVTCGALKLALKPALGIYVAGGKGKASRNAQRDIGTIAEPLGLDAKRLKYCSRMSAKVDNNCVQDTHNLYHHSFFVAESGKWAVVQQGLSPEARTARRYHWSSETLGSFVEVPRSAIAGATRLDRVLDMTARSSLETRHISLDLVKDNPQKLSNMLGSIRAPGQRELNEFADIGVGSVDLKLLDMPSGINWKAVRRAYDYQPRDYEELIGLKGIGPMTVRALALISELVYGKEPSWQDPIKYSFAVGGKDGVPYPVDRKTMDKSIELLKTGVERAKLDDKERLRALRRLEGFLPKS